MVLEDTQNFGDIIYELPLGVTAIKWWGLNFCTKAFKAFPTPTVYRIEILYNLKKYVIEISIIPFLDSRH